MPFELRRGEDVVASFDGITYDEMLPDELGWMIDFPEMLAKTEASNVLAREPQIALPKHW